MFVNNSNEGQDVLLARFNKNTGECIALDRIPSTTGYMDTGTALAADASGDYILGGGFESDIYINGTTLTNSGNQSDFFVAKYATEPCHELSVSQHSSENIKVFPNPAKNSITVNTDTDLKFALYTITNQLVNIGVINSMNPAIITEGLPAGTYILKLEDNRKKIHTVKIVKQ